MNDEFATCIAALGEGGADQVAGFASMIATTIANAVAQGEIPARMVDEEAVALVDGLVRSGLIEFDLGRAWFLLRKERAAKAGSIRVPAGCPPPETMGDLHRL